MSEHSGERATTTRAAAEGDLVSVILPAYNAAPFIEETLASIAAQTHRELEIIVVDDASTDETAALVEAFARSDPRVSLYRRPHAGMMPTRNFAARKSRGAYIAPCDCDDVWRADKIELQLRALREGSPRAGVAYCWSQGINEKNEIIFPDWSRHEAEGDVLSEMIVDSLPGSGSSPLIRRSCFEAVGGYPEKTPPRDEWEMYIALAGAYDYVLVRQHLVGYRIRSGSLSSNYQAMTISLAATRRWIAETWPDTPRDVLRRRDYTVNSYLSFIAARRRHPWRSFQFRIKAWLSRPDRIVSADTMGFYMLLIGQLFGVNVFYFAFWRPPRRWSSDAPIADGG
jgi:glycosyltransferase involved in cell wall biosynthesis